MNGLVIARALNLIREAVFEVRGTQVVPGGSFIIGSNNMGRYSFVSMLVGKINLSVGFDWSRC